MTRSKKTRKQPSTAPTRLSNEEKKQLAELRNKKPKKLKGKTPGNRQQEAKKNSQQNQSNNANRDPRLGSKKPIELIPAAKKQSAPKAKVEKNSPIAAVRTIESDDQQTSLAKQLEAIETNEQLLAIIEKQEQEIELSQDEVSLYNEMMEQHEAISKQIDVQTETELELEQPSEITEDDDSLLDKLDNNYFSEEE